MGHIAHTQKIGHSPRQHPAQDGDTVLSTDLAANVAHPQAQRAGQRLVAVLGRPNDMIRDDSAPEVSLQDGMRSVMMGLAAEESIKSGQMVEF